MVPFVLAGALTTIACAVPFRAPGEGGPRWHELTSQHFVVSTDLPVDEAELAVRDLEEYRAALLATAWPGDPSSPGQLRVVILARQQDWRAFEGELGGFFTEALFQPLIALGARASDETRIAIRHELTHHVSRLHVREQPDWLAEGLATFFETMVYDRERGEVLFGLPQPSRLALLRQGGRLPVRAALDGSLGRVDRERFYATSWLIVHHFMSRERDAFARYMRALDAGQPAPAAWSQAFGGLTPETLQSELGAYWGLGRPLVASRRFRAPAFSITTRPLGAARVFALRALLHLRGLGKQAPEAARTRARTELAASLRRDPSDVVALALAAFALEDPIDVAAARAATVRHPRDFLAWVLLYKAAGGDFVSAEGRRAAALALRLSADNPAVKLPFGPRAPMFASGTAAVACRKEFAAASRPPPGCSGDGEGNEAARADLRTIAESDVAWCFFEHPHTPTFDLVVETDGAGRARSVCARTLAVSPPGVAACIERVVAALPLARGGCARRGFSLGLLSDGRLSVFAD